MRSGFLSGALLAASACLATDRDRRGPARAAPPAGATAPAPAKAADPVVAKVGDREIHLSDVAQAAQNLPSELRGAPGPVLYPILLNQLVDRELLVLDARKHGIDKQPAVQHAMREAADGALSSGLRAPGGRAGGDGRQGPCAL